MLQNVNVTLNTIHSVYLISQPSNHNLLHHTSQNEIVFKPSINNQHWEVSNCQVTDIWSLEKAKQNESSLLTGYEPAGQQCDLLQQLSSLSSESTLSKKKYNHNLLIILFSYARQIIFSQLTKSLCAIKKRKPCNPTA